MTTVAIPYGRTTLKFQAPADRLEAVLEARTHHYKPKASEAALVERALENPIGSLRLSKLVRDKNKIVIITSDHTRPLPTKITAPRLLAEIRKGNPNADITFLVATGYHRETTREELLEKFGEQIATTEKIEVHNCWNRKNMINAGKLPSGGDLVINKLAMEADLLISEGFIEPHVFAGFSGGRKSILPGIVSDVTVLANHCAEFIANEKSRPGILEGNPIHQDMLFAAKTAKLTFILNVVIDGNKKVINAFAGDLEEAHLAGGKFVEELARVPAKPADIVITSNGGFPLDQNIYQQVKCLTSAEAACREGGVIIACAACNDGHGGEDMYSWLKNGAEAVMEKIINTGRESTVPDQWATQIMARIQLKHKIIFVTDQCDHQVFKDMGFLAAYNLEEAMRIAELYVGTTSKITIIPDGVAVIVN
jgi:nickel-dependent lactate racemase